MRVFCTINSSMNDARITHITLGKKAKIPPHMREKRKFKKKKSDKPDRSEKVSTQIFLLLKLKYHVLVILFYIKYTLHNA